MTFPDKPLTDLLRHAVQLDPDHPAVAYGERRLDFGGLDQWSDRVAAFLGERGVVKGDRVALYCPNTDAFVVAYFGIVKAGGIVVPINVLLSPEEVRYLLADSEASGFIFHAAFDPVVEVLRRDGVMPGLAVRIGDGRTQEGIVPWEQVLASSAAVPTPAFDTADDLAVIIYTSGTTGRPKGAMLTHRNLAANTWSVRQAMDLATGQDVVLVVLPLFHAFAATAGMLAPLFAGSTIVPLPRFEPQQVADVIEAHRVTLFLGVPSMYQLLMRLPGGAESKLASLRACVSGGAALPVDLLNRFEARFGVPLCEGDGPTECGPVTCVNPPNGLRKAGSVGPALPLVEMRIADENGGKLPDGQAGEIQVRAPSVMKGYWRQPDATRAVFNGDWLRTGDLGYRDSDGYFFIVDRIKDLIIVNGMNVYPRVVEEVLYRIPALREVAVVGESDVLHGEVPVAYVCVKSEAAVTEAEVRAFCRNHLGRYEIPRRVYFLEDLPKNATGKIVKRALRRSGETEHGVGGAPPET